MKPFHVMFIDDIESFASLCELLAGDAVQPVYRAQWASQSEGFFFATPELRAFLKMLVKSPDQANARLEASGKLRVFRADVTHWGLNDVVYHGGRHQLLQDVTAD